MIIEKTWERYVWYAPYKGGGKNRYQHVYTGWFLLGIIPLFIKRETTRTN